MMVIASLDAPSLSSASVAPPINRLTMKSFHRLATIATRKPSALSRPWIVLANQSLLFHSCLMRRVPQIILNAQFNITRCLFNHQLSNEYRFRLGGMSRIHQFYGVRRMSSMECGDLSTLFLKATCRLLSSLFVIHQNAPTSRRAEKQRQVAALHMRT